MCLIYTCTHLFHRRCTRCPSRHSLCTPHVTSRHEAGRWAACCPAPPAGGWGWVGDAGGSDQDVVGVSGALSDSSHPQGVRCSNSGHCSNCSGHCSSCPARCSNCCSHRSCPGRVSGVSTCSGSLTRDCHRSHVLSRVPPWRPAAPAQSTDTGGRQGCRAGRPDLKTRIMNIWQ